MFHFTMGGFPLNKSCELFKQAEVFLFFCFLLLVGGGFHASLALEATHIPLALRKVIVIQVMRYPSDKTRKLSGPNIIRAF